MGKAHINLTFVKGTGASANTWSASGKLSGPSGHVWTVTVISRSGSQTLTAHLMVVNLV